MRIASGVALLALCFVACSGNNDDDPFASSDATSDTTDDTGGADVAVDSDAGADAGGSCGDGVVDNGEACDGAELGGISCTDRGFASGTLRCTDACAFDESSCSADPGQTCGDEIVDAPEECDGAVDETCADLGFDFGVLGCTDACEYDDTGCGDTAILTAMQRLCRD